MPTTKPRYAVTETDEVAAALRLAALRWPDDRARPSRLLLRLVEEGAEAIAPAVDTQRSARLDAIKCAAGSYDYPDDYLNSLRDEWPA